MSQLTRRLRHWQSEPLTVWRIGEAMVRMLLAGFVGISISVVLAQFVAKEWFTVFGFLLPFYIVLDWVMPDD